MAQPFDVPLDAEFALLDTSQTVTEIQEEEDIFQCGRCKKQFTSLQLFISHKSSCRANASNNLAIRVQSAPAPTQQTAVLNHQNTANTATYNATANQVQHVINKQQSVGNNLITSSQASQLALGQSIILTDDLMGFTSIDPATLQGSTLQTLQVGNLSAVSGSLTGSTGKLLSSVPGGGATQISFTPEQLQQTQEQFTLSGQQQNNGLPTVLTVSTGNIGQINQIIVNNSSPNKTGRSGGGYQTLGTNSGLHTSNTLQGTTMTIQGTPTQGTSLITLDHGAMPQTQGAVVTDHATGVMAKRLPRMKMEENDTDPDNVAGKKKLKCQYCDKVFSKNFDLQQHVRSHTGEKPFQCIVCGRAFAQKSNVKKHMQTHKVWPKGTSHTLPEQAPPQPTDCATGAGLTVEIGATDGSVNKATEVVSIGEDENKSIVIDNSFRCQYCGQKYKTYFLLKTHMVEHKDQQVYKCILKECGLQFRDLDSFLEHTKQHSKDMVYRCHMCNKQFPSLLELGVHQYSHSLYPNQGPKTGPRYFRCAKCNNKYSTPEALQHHTETVSHNFPCKYCSKIFTCEKYLRRHLVVHGTAVEFICEQCDKAFKTEHYLKMHLLTHSDEKPFACDVCPSAFNRKDKLRRHQLVHESSRKFKCPFRNHTGCTREFNRQDKLKCHIIAHSGIRPYKCQMCNKSFSRKPHLREHQKIHDRDFKYICECERGFVRERQYLAHMEVCHRNSGDTYPPPPKLKRRPGRPKFKMITVTQQQQQQRRGGGSGGRSHNRPIIPAISRRGRTRMVRPPARYADAADEEEVIGSLEEVIEPTTKEEIDAVVNEAHEMLTEGQVNEDAQILGPPAELPDAIIKVPLDSEGVDPSEQGFVVIASGDNGDGTLHNVNVLPQGNLVQDSNGVITNINFVHQQQDGSLIYNQGEPISLENLQKAALLQQGSNIATLVVDGSQVVAQGDGGAIATLIPGEHGGGGGGGGIHYVSAADAGYQHHQGTVTYVTGSGDQMQIAVEYQGVLDGEDGDAGGGGGEVEDYQGHHVYATVAGDGYEVGDGGGYDVEGDGGYEAGVDGDYEGGDGGYEAADGGYVGDPGDGGYGADTQGNEGGYGQEEGYTVEAYQVGGGDPMLPAEGGQAGE